ncbi:glycoside hydrolase family 3 C-terminal domain-containing protein [[Empedobacter] haloabium]|uniref:Glycoside hydrolase family 3 C-terminal domain-containing protein n=1 Tax=[Empedobacter] haloabium TaxID=592317 RepID=A0ABZ1UG38_9BURK
MRTPLKSTARIALLALAAWPALAAVADAGGAPAQRPWLDRSLDPDRRAALALQAMTQQEKLNWAYGYFGADHAASKSRKIAAALPFSAGYIPGIARLGLPALFETDAGIGVATQYTTTPRERTALPAGIATAATWNRQLAYEGGRMIGAEARASGFNVMLAGGVNLLREPRNGRNFEYAGEDPLHAGLMVAAQVKGIESNHVIATLKHFALNAQETGRFQLDARIDPAAARMSDLLAFQIALEHSDAGSFMCAYNRVNGPYACESPWLLDEVLKRDWGFKGYVMSDWGATHSTVPAANAGLDQQSGGEFDKSNYFGAALAEAVENGHVPARRLDDLALRVLRTMFAKGVVDHPVKEGGAIDFDAHARVTQADAEEGIVLLKNADRLLPLRPGMKIAIVGGHADRGVLAGGGSSLVYPIGGNAVPGLLPATWPGPVMYYPSSPLKAMQARAGTGSVTYDDGTEPARAASVAANADVVLVFATQWVGEALDANSLALPDRQDELIAAVAAANPRTAVVLENSGPVLMPWLDRVAGVVEAWYPGTRGGEAIARVLFGEVNPSGRLPATFPQSEQQLPRPRLDGDPAQPDRRFAVDYHEGAAVGYKWFDLKGHQPLFPFGYGLSYTSFGYSGLAARVVDGKVRVRFQVANTGQLAGKDVPQLYVAPVRARWEAPKRLAGWDKVDLAPGATRDVELTIDPRLFGTIRGNAKTWKIAGGAYKVLLARHAGDPRPQTVTINLPATVLDLAGQPLTTNKGQP